jgi:hypothetical protein
MAYAHALIELEDGTRIQRGDTVKKDVPGYDDLVESGAVSDEKYDPAQDASPAPDEVELDGVRYVKVDDGAEAADARS